MATLLDPRRADEAKQKVKFVFVTGPDDFRHGNILDIYKGGFLKDGYQVKLLDVPGMGHAICSAESLSEGLGFLEKRKR